MLFVALGSFVLLIVMVYLVAAPAVRSDPAEESAVRSALTIRKDRLLSDIRELDMDLATGKLEERDHHRLRAATLVAAAETLRSLEETQTSEGAPTASEAQGVVDDDPMDDDAAIEARIAARKRELESTTCRSCGAIVDPDDAYCRRCGASVAPGRVG